MPQKPDTTVTISDFSGLVANADTIDVPPGAAEEQVNATSIVPGELRVRQGIKPVVFEPF